MSEQAAIDVPVTQTVSDHPVQFAEAEGRSVSEIIEDLVLDYERRDLMRRSGESMRRLQQEAVRSGASKMTLGEINEEIAAARREMASAPKGA